MLKQFAIAILREQIKRKQEEEHLEKVIRDNFVPERGSRCGRQFVNSTIARQIGVEVTTTFIHKLRRALKKLLIFPTRSHGIRYYANCKAINPITNFVSVYQAKANAGQALHRGPKPRVLVIPTPEDDTED